LARDGLILEAIMAVRKNESMGFADAAIDGLGGPRSAVMLKRLNALTPWETIAAPIRRVLEYNNRRWPPAVLPGTDAKVPHAPDGCVAAPCARAINGSFPPLSPPPNS